MFNLSRLTASFVLAGMMLTVPVSAMATPLHAQTFQIAESDGIPSDEWTDKDSKPVRAELAKLLKKKLGSVKMKFGFTTDDVAEAWHNHRSVRYRTVGVWCAATVEKDDETKGIVRYYNLMADRRGDGKWGKWYLDDEYATPGNNYYIDPDLIK